MNESRHRAARIQAAADRAAEGDVPEEGRGVHCIHGRPSSAGVVLHAACAMVCNCPCHWGGTP